MRMNEGMKIFDIVEVRKVKNGEIDESVEGLILKTNNHPSIWQRIKRWLGLYKCAGDAMMNWGILKLSESIYDTYSHISVGVSSSSPGDFTLIDLVSPTLVRIAATKGYTTTFIENDTAVFTGIFTPDGTYTIVETGIHTAATGGNMGARQTTCNISTTPGVEFGIIWKVCVARG